MPRRNNLNFKNISAGIICVLIVAYIINRPEPNVQSAPSVNQDSASTEVNLPTSSAETTQNLRALDEAFRNRQSDVQIQALGKVQTLLADDNKGSRHQRFILRVSPSQTVLVAHNIDLAPKITDLKKGDLVEFYGEYEWNSKGGVIHWTHHDPNKKHIDGWLRHKGKVYE
ncbi:DUF3465 domain-containing protein [Thalassotalea litorea]|uniref:DUF3465 domain-containing protein n=1 Tax=Thalassotalea litorea TaxID=2020715 RepID=A0A5R9IMH4_9GAMM|nr:DUF3465 domain-containing protein [Thalassotalea litorea]TLU66735.1 DUF3465 domain-containing protein [Thalassotalea litorea]